MKVVNEDIEIQNWKAYFEIPSIVSERPSKLIWPKDPVFAQNFIGLFRLISPFTSRKS